MKKDRAGVIAPPPLLYLAFVIGGVLVQRDWGARHIALSSQIAGWTLISLGALLAMWAEAAFLRADTPANPYRPSTTVVDRGPFAFTRNPMYVAMAIVSAGIALCFESWAAIALLPVAIAVIRYGVIAREERYLTEKFGDAYRDYQRRVRRWI